MTKDKTECFVVQRKKKCGWNVYGYVTYSILEIPEQNVVAS